MIMRLPMTQNPKATPTKYLLSCAKGEPEIISGIKDPKTMAKPNHTKTSLNLSLVILPSLLLIG
jgi:hypothetical protein